MKVLKAEIVKNDTKEVLESSEFSGSDAQDQLDAWLTMRRAAGESAGIMYGEEFERDIVVTDISEERTKHLEIEDRTAAREFCLWVIDAIAAYNKKYLSEAQMLNIFGTPAFQGIILALLTGGTKTARGLIAQVGPQLYPADFVAGIVSKMDAQLAKEDEESGEEQPTA